MLRARLKLEETLEFLDAAGLQLVDIATGKPIDFGRDDRPNTAQIEPIEGAKPNMELMVDACSDDSVVNTGTFIALGVRMDPMLELTDANNLMKIANGHKDAGGKFIKSPTHPAPNYRVALELQGWVEPVAAPQPYVNALAAEPVRATSAKPSMTPVMPEIVGPTQPAGLPQSIPAELAGVLKNLPSGEVVYFGVGLEQALEAIRSGRKTHAAELITRCMRETLGTGLPTNLIPDAASLRQTAPGDPGPRGVAFTAAAARTSVTTPCPA